MSKIISPTLAESTKKPEQEHGFTKRQKTSDKNDHSFLPRRALFYSHDSVGLGHLRRTLLLNQDITQYYPDLSTIILTGSAMAHAFRIPPRTDYVKLPCVTKLDNELYESRFLNVSDRELFKLREDIIFSTAANFKPDLLFVDNVPLGLKGELRKTLAYIRRKSPRTKVFLNLRDIIDSADHVIPLWSKLGIYDVLDHYYDHINIYGESKVFDLLTEYRVPESVQSKACFCGYIPRKTRPASVYHLRKRLTQGNKKLILVTVGGGSDGFPIIQNFLRCVPLVFKNFIFAAVVICGPEMKTISGNHFRAWRDHPSILFAEFTDNFLNYLAAADLVVSMGGYNTISEILALGKRAIVIPRIKPRKEQLIRAERMQELGLISMIHPSDLTPQLLARKIAVSLASQNGGKHTALNFSAFKRIHSELDAIDWKQLKCG